MTINEDKRSGIDRRQDHLIFPFQNERRLNQDPRRPEIVVKELPNIYWEMYFTKPSSYMVLQQDGVSTSKSRDLETLDA